MFCDAVRRHLIYPSSIFKIIMDTGMTVEEDDKLGEK